MPESREINAPAATAEDEVVICGMSMGTADADAIENTLVSEREPVEGFATFIDF